MDAFTALGEIESLLIGDPNKNIEAAKQVIQSISLQLTPTEKPLFTLLDSHLDALALGNHPTALTLTFALICQAELMLIRIRH